MNKFVLVTMLLMAPTWSSHAVAQENSSRLLREQNEILRKSERLRALMTRLLERYERDGRTEQVRLLKSGIEHLEQSRLLRAASAIQSSLDDGALDDALREQSTVVEELERLLDILLDRKSIENLDEEIEQTQRLIDQTDALIQRQQDLRAQADDSRDARASAAERALVDTLEQLASDQRAEAVENDRQAGLRAPVLETALRRLQSLLESQAKLEAGTRRQLEDAPDASRETAFELGALEQAQRELSGARGAQRELQRLAESANELSEASKAASEDRVRSAYDKLRARLEDQIANGELAPDARATLDQRLDRLRKAQPDGVDQASRDELGAAADEIAEAVKQTADSAGETNDQAQSALRDRARQAAEAARDTDADGKPKDTATSRALQQAAQAMQESVEASEGNRSGEALAKTTDALRKLAEARQSFRDANPAPSTRAADMAASADQVARDLRSAPMAEESERTAADALDTARDALRQAGEQLERDESGDTPATPEAVEPKLSTSRAALEQAMQALTGALESANEGREEAMQGATARQQALAQRARETREQLDRARDQGEISPEQRDAAERAVQQAEQSMQRANEKLGGGKQSEAAQDQKRAADALDKAAEGIENNRPVSEDEKQKLQEIGKQQAELEKDIINLAKLAEERKNENASKALEQAAQSAERAARALERGDRQEAEEQQAKTQDELEQARDELREERDRYMDLRQEELLFKIGEELQQFLDAQRSLTEQTEEAGKALADGGRLSRPARRKLNQIGENESELVARTEFILQALVEEGVLVFSHALRANVTDLKEVASRLAGRSPDPGDYTVLLQRDVEERAEKLIEALRRERERRDKEKQNKSGPQKGENKFADQREPLVPMIAELQMLRQMEEDMRTRTQQVERLVQTAGADGVTEFDLALAERLAHQHSALTEIFKQIKTAIEKAMEQGEADDPFGDPEKQEKDK